MDFKQSSSYFFYNKYRHHDIFANNVLANFLILSATLSWSIFPLKVTLTVNWWNLGSVKKFKKKTWDHNDINFCFSDVSIKLFLDLRDHEYIIL